MADEKPVDEQVRDLLDGWNPAPTSDFLARVVGQPVPVGDTRATNAGRPEGADHPRNFANSKVDAERMFTDDVNDGDGVDDEADEVSYDDMTKSELKDEIDRRNADRDEDDHLSKSGNKADLVARLEDDDEAAGSSEDDDDE